MSGIINIEKSKPSSVKRLKMLPRFGIVIDIAGHEITYRHAPIAETLLNLKARGFSVKNLIAVAMEQFKEINLPKAPTTMAKSAKKSSAPKKKRANKQA